LTEANRLRPIGKYQDMSIIIVYGTEAAKPYNTIKHSKTTVKVTKTTEMYSIKT